MGSSWQEFLERSFESGTLEGFAGVTTFGPPDGSLDVEVSLSPDSHEGAWSLQCRADGSVWWPDPDIPTQYWGRIIGYASAPLGPVPIAWKYRVEYWIKAIIYDGGTSEYGYTQSGITVVSATGDLIARIADVKADTFPFTPHYFCATDGAVICDWVGGEWVRHVIEWDAATRVTEHFVYNSAGLLLGSYQMVRAGSGEMIPAAIRCGIRAELRVVETRYDDITVSAYMPQRSPSRRRRAAWMNMERPAFF